MIDERFLIRSLLLTLALGCVGAAHAQEQFGAITGLVQDESGGVLPGATVVITSRTTGRVVRVVTDEGGKYRANGLEPGRYDVEVSLSGFARMETPDVLVLLGKTLEVDTVLKVGRLTEAVQVKAEPAPLIDMRATTVAHNVTTEEFERLPKTRSFQSLALTAPSVNTGEIEGGYQVNGASSAENAFTIDGVVTSSLINGRSRQDAAFEYVQEVQVKTTGIGAEYGGAMGGVVSAVTKSGGNVLRGEVHGVFDGSRFSAGPVKRLVLSPVDDKSVSYVQDDKMPVTRVEAGGSAGGRIITDRLFFFGSLSPRLIRRTNTYQFANGAQTGDIGQRQTLTQAFGKITYARDRIHADVSVLHSPTQSTGTLSAYNGTMPNGISSSLSGNAANLERGFETRERSVSGTVDIALSDHSFLTLRGSSFFDDYRDTGVSMTTSVAYQTSSIGMANVPPELQGSAGTQNTPRALITSFDTTRRAFVGADYNHEFSAARPHTLKAGVGFQRSTNDASAAYPGGYVLLFWNRTFSFAGTSGRGAYGYYEVNDRGFEGRAGSNMASLYVQDQWRVDPRVTLSLGLRAETEEVPTYRPDMKPYALKFGLADKIAPRLGVSVDVTGTGRVKVYGSWGRDYDWTKFELARNLGSDFWTTSYRALDTLDVNSLSLSNMPGANLWIVPDSYRDQAVPSLDRIDPLTRPTYQDSTSAGLEYQLGAASVLTAHYVHNDLQQVIEDIGTLIDGNVVLYIANPGEGNATTMATTGPTAPFPTPKVARVYDALEFGWNRRLSNHWFASASYTYSRLYGNYAGLSSSDEIRTPTTGATWRTQQAQAGSIGNPGGSVRKNWNIDELMFDAQGHLDVRGRLATDRPHVVKLYGAYTFPFGTELGMFFYGGSGTPVSTYVNTTNQTEVFVNGRGDMGRTPVLTQTDLLLSQGFSLTRDKKLRVELNVLNLFNQKTPRHIFNWLNRGGGAPRASSAMNLSQTDLAKGYDYHALIRATPDGANAYDPRYGMYDLFNEGTLGRISIKLLF